MRGEHHVLVRLLRSLDRRNGIEHGLLAEELRFEFEPQHRLLPVLGEAEDEAVVLAVERDRRCDRVVGLEDLRRAPAAASLRCVRAAAAACCRCDTRRGTAAAIAYTARWCAAASATAAPATSAGVRVGERIREARDLGTRRDRCE